MTDHDDFLCECDRAPIDCLCACAPCTDRAGEAEAEEAGL